MSATYCLPIVKKKPQEVLQTIQANLTDYRYFEVWLDYIETADEAFITELIDMLGDRLIVLFRRQNLDPMTMVPEQRQAILTMLSNKAARLDLDIITQRVELDYIRQQALVINTIVSYHNYQETPSTVQLQSIIDTMKPYQPAIYKLAGLCKGPEDSLRLLQLLLDLKAQSLPAIIIGMGEHGLVTRIFGNLWGNAMIFAPRDMSGQTAPGQLTRENLETIFKALES